MVVLGSSGVLAPGKWRWLRSLAWMVALCITIVIGFNAVAKAALWLLSDAAEPSDGARLAAATLGCLAIVVIYALAVRFGERRAVSELELRRAPADLLAGLAIGAAAISAVVGTLWLFDWVVIEPTPVSKITLALRDSVRSGLIEELLLRLVILRLLWRAFGVWPAIGGSALLFGMLHLGNPDSSLFAMACLIAGEGIGIGLYLLTGRLWASAGMHAAWNFTQGWLFGAAVSGTGEIAGGPLATRPAPGVPELLSGGGFGPEGSIAALLVSLLASAAVLGLAWRRGCFTAADH